jgi:hypothetical protein
MFGGKRKFDLFEEVCGFASGYIEKPLFREMLLGALQLEFTSVDATRVGDDRYMAEIGLNKVSVYNQEIQHEPGLSDLDVSKLKNPGYMMGYFKRIIGRVEAATQTGDMQGFKDKVKALCITSIAFVRYILAIYPDYLDPLRKMAPALKHAAEHPNTFRQSTDFLLLH